jgi:heterotetrameric sarcosine oxidase delta subunit
LLLIACPCCGPRAEIEFDWGGPSHVERPGPPDAVSAPEWGAYLYFRDNLKGSTAERWRHTHGCAQWFNLVRDTATHQILAVYRMGEPPPALGNPS